MNAPALPHRPPELVEIEARRARLRQDRQTVEAELHRLEQDLWSAQNLDDDARDTAAERLAAGEAEATSQGIIPEQLEILRSRLDLLRRAEHKVAVRVAEHRDRHNRNIAGTFRPEHKKASQRIARALRELVDANKAEQELRDRAPSGQLPPMNFPNIGQLGAAGGPAKYWMEHARRHGYLLDEDEADCPAAAL